MTHSATPAAWAATARALRFEHYDPSEPAQEAITALQRQIVELRERGRVIPMTLADGDSAYILPGYNDVTRATYEHDRYANWNPALNDAAQSAEFARALMLNPDHSPYSHPQRVLRRELALQGGDWIWGWILTRADNAVRQARTGGPFDAVNDLARPYVAHTLCELAGFLREDRPMLLHLTEAAFDVLAPFDHIALSSGTISAVRLHSALAELTTQRDIQAGGWLEELLKTPMPVPPDYSEGPLAACLYLLSLGVAAVHAVGNLVKNLTDHPQQLAKLAVTRGDEAIRATVRESLRYTPVFPWSTRFAIEDDQFDSTEIPQGSRLLLLHHSANHHAEAWGKGADDFEMQRMALHRPDYRPRIHGCSPHPEVGSDLIEALLDALLRAFLRAKVIPRAEGEAHAAESTVLCGWKNLTVRLTE